MRILVAHLYHESNTFCIEPTRKEEFEVYRGRSVIDNLAGCKALIEAGAEIVPTLYVSRWSSGTVTEDAYLAFEEEILDHVRREKDAIDGIYLSLHGGMTVENIGSGEYRVLADVRAIVGDEMPISVSLDMHANNRTGLETLANVITGYHTAPHEDVEETQLSAARALVDMIKTGLRPHPEMVRVPMLLVGERAITSMEPLKTIFDRCAELEADPRIHAATLFVGMAWGDTPNTTVTTMVCPCTRSNIWSSVVASYRVNWEERYLCISREADEYWMFRWGMKRASLCRMPENAAARLGFRVCAAYIRIRQVLRIFRMLTWERSCLQDSTVWRRWECQQKEKPGVYARHL